MLRLHGSQSMVRTSLVFIKVDSYSHLQDLYVYLYILLFYCFSIFKMGRDVPRLSSYLRVPTHNRGDRWGVIISNSLFVLAYFTEQ